MQVRCHVKEIIVETTAPWVWRLGTGRARQTRSIFGVDGYSTIFKLLAGKGPP